MSTKALFPQVRPLSAKPTPGELAEFSLAVRGALEALQRGAFGAGQASAAPTATVISGGGSAPGGGWDLPTTPAGFTVTGAFATILLAWTPAAYNGHAYTEVWRAQVDDLGQAVLVGATAAAVYADQPPASALAEIYYYWVRHVNRDYAVSAYNAAAGTAGRTADDPEYLLELAVESKWRPLHDYAAGALALPTRPNGYVYEVTADGGASGSGEPAWPTVIDATVADAGLTWKCKAEISLERLFQIALVGGVPKLALRELFLVDGIIKRAMVQDAAIDNAKIADLSAAKLLAGVITAANIFLGDASRVHLDGANQRIVVSDGTRDRVILGNIGGGNWGLTIYDVTGGLILSSGGQYGAGIDNSAAAVGGNELPNVFLSQKWDNWLFGNASGQSGIGFNQAGWFVSGAPPHTPYIYQSGVVQANDYLYSAPFAVIPGETYGVSAYTGAHRCTVSVTINFYDAAGNIVGASPEDSQSANTGGTSLSGYRRLFSRGVAPASATQARVFVIKTGTTPGYGYTDSWLFFTRPQYGRVNPNQTEPPPWTPGPQLWNQGAFGTLDQITSGNISTYIANLAVNTLQLAGQAVTFPIATYASPDTTCLANQWTSLNVTQVMNTTGAPVMLTFCFSGRLNVSTESRNVMIRVLRSGIQIYSGSCFIQGFDELPISGNVMDNPPAGTMVYDLQIFPDQRTVYARNRSMMAIEVKK